MNINFYYKVNDEEKFQSFTFKNNDENLLKVIKNEDRYILDKNETLNNLENNKKYEILFSLILGWIINDLDIELSF